MNNFRKIYQQLLDYSDEKLIAKCAEWGYEISQTLLRHGHYLVQAREERAEQSSPFMYAVATAVIVGQFAKKAFNDQFDEEATIDLNLLDMSFEEVRGFINEDTAPDRLKLLTEANSVGLQDIWTAMWEWKSHIYKDLTEIYKTQGEKDPDYRIFASLLNLYKNTDEDGIFDPTMTDGQKSEAYGFVSNGFQY